MEVLALADNFVVEKDGKKYVYRSTSVYDPQTKRKRTVSEYIGKIDPVTGELIEKKSRNRPGSAPQGSIVVKNYGACHAFVSIAESCGLRDDLYSAFGQDGDYILASAISLILTGGPMYYMEPEIETNKRGNFIVDEETNETSMKGVFAGGDIVLGAATVILAMGQGRKAAAAINAYLEEKA